MLYEHDLRVRLRERRNRLARADHRMFDNELGLFVSWLEGEPYLRALLAEIEAADITLEGWKQSGGLGRLRLEFPDDELERAKVCLEICREGNAQDYGHEVTAKGNLNDMVEAYVDTFVDRLVEYLEDRIDEGSAVLGILHRYKRRVEWFRRRRLYEAYRADTKRGEATLDADLREYLLDQGVPFPFSQVRSPSGQSDVVAGLETEDPLALEVKLFLPDAGKDEGYVRQGFSQAYRYSSDYGLPVGYLLVFNLTSRHLVFEVSADRPGWPASVRVGDRTIFLIGVDANPDMVSASRDRKLARHTISEAFLLDHEREAA